MTSQLVQDVAVTLFVCAIESFILFWVGFGSVLYYVALAKANTSEETVAKALAEFGNHLVKPLRVLYVPTGEDAVEFITKTSVLGGMIARISSSVMIVLSFVGFGKALVRESDIPEKVILNGFVIVYGAVGLLLTWRFGHRITGITKNIQAD